MSILTKVRLRLAAGALALTAAGACGGRSAAPFEVRQRFEADRLPTVDVRFFIQPEHRRADARYVRAVMATLKHHGEWLGPLPQRSLTVIDPPWRDAPQARAPDAVVLDRSRWWSTPTSMTPELAAARAMSRRFWTALLDTHNLPSWFIGGLVEYSARRVVVPLFEKENLAPGYAMAEWRYFGDFVPWFARIRLLPESDGDPLAAYRAMPRAGVASVVTQEQERSLTAKTVLALNTLERWLGQPVLDEALAEFVTAFRGERPGLEDLARVTSASSGQDLSWFFDQVFGGSAVFDYAVADLWSVPAPGGGFDTTLVAVRTGDGMFTGTSAPRVGTFERGRGLSVLVTFANGHSAMAFWDGRDERKTFKYHAPARAVSAVIDPDRTLVIDVNRANNSRTTSPENRAGATPWEMRWMVWLEDALLTYSVFV